MLLKQLDRYLEHPDITRTLRTGYPRQYDFVDTNNFADVQEVSEEQFVEIVKNRKVDT